MDELMFLPLKLEPHTWDKTIYQRSIQWQSQKFMLGGARLKDKIGNKKLININYKISKQLYDNVIVIQNLT